MIEVLFLTYGFFLLLTLGAVVTFLCVTPKTRTFGKKLRLPLAFLCLIYFFAFLGGGDLVRFVLAKRTIAQIEPVISALEVHKANNGVYPSSMGEAAIPSFPSIKRELLYESNGKSYMLRFIMDGPPFGHHFIYSPSQLYEDFPNNEPFQLKRRIGKWGWYIKV